LLKEFSDKLLALDARVKAVSIAFWEALLSFKLLPIRDVDKQFEFLSEADRIEEEPINRNYSVTMYTIITAVAIGFSWAALSPIDQVVSGRGRVVSAEQNIILQASENSEIKEVLVSVGQAVKKGDILFVLDTTIPQADLAQTQSAYEAVLRALEIAGSEVKTMQARIRSATETEQMTRQLVEKNFQSKRALNEQEERRLSLQQALLGVKTKQNELLSQRAALEQQLIKAQRRKEEVQVTAPRDGIVLEMSPLSKGSIARATEPIVTIVPTDTPMVAEAYISPSGISGVSAGQRVKLKLDAFPFQRYGYLQGSVVSLSPDTVQAREQGEGKSYVARIEFAATQETSKMLSKVIPGMTLVAEVLTDERTVLQYIFDPLLKIRKEALQEKS